MARTWTEWERGVEGVIANLWKKNGENRIKREREREGGGVGERERVGIKFGMGTLDDINHLKTNILVLQDQFGVAWYIYKIWWEEL